MCRTPARPPRLVEPLADHDDVLLTSYLAEQPMTAERVRGELAAQTRTGQVHPVFFGSAITGAGVDELTAGVVALLPAAGGDVAAEPSGSIFKIERAPDGQKVALIRMFNGSLRVRDRVRFGRAEDKVTANQRVRARRRYVPRGFAGRSDSSGLGPGSRPYRRPGRSSAPRRRARRPLPRPPWRPL